MAQGRWIHAFSRDVNTKKKNLVKLHRQEFELVSAFLNFLCRLPLFYQRILDLG